MTGPRQLVIYADSRHSVGNVPAANLGPLPLGLVADWLVARLNGKPFASERWFVEASGRVVKATRDYAKLPAFCVSSIGSAMRW